MACAGLQNPAGGILSLKVLSNRQRKASSSGIIPPLIHSLNSVSDVGRVAAFQSRVPRCLCPPQCRSSGRVLTELISVKDNFTCNGLSSHLRFAGNSHVLRGLKGPRRNFQVRSKSPDDDAAPQYSSDAKIRSEVISPFRSVRMFFYLAFIASGAIGSLITLTRFAAALSNAPNAQPILEIFKDLGIDLGAVAIFALLYRSDAKAQEISLAKLSREEILSTLRVELANKRVVTLQQLRGIARIVIISGPTSYIEEAFRLSEPFKENLLERGVLVVPYCLDGIIPSPEPVNRAVQQESGSVAVQNQPKVALADRWTATPIYTNEWSRWLNGQKKLANVQEGKPVYISLRLDGRVRGSGVGFPPWEKIAVQLPPLKGIWKGPLDGMDGRI